MVDTKTEGGVMYAVKAARKDNRLVGCFKPNGECTDTMQFSGNRVLLEDAAAFPLSDNKDIDEFIEKLREKRKFLETL